MRIYSKDIKAQSVSGEHRLCAMGPSWLRWFQLEVEKQNIMLMQCQTLNILGTETGQKHMLILSQQREVPLSCFSGYFKLTLIWVNCRRHFHPLIPQPNVTIHCRNPRMQRVLQKIYFCIKDDFSLMDSISPVLMTC